MANALENHHIILQDHLDNPDIVKILSDAGKINEAYCQSPGVDRRRCRRFVLESSRVNFVRCAESF